jgi:hypothetical protein
MMDPLEELLRPAADEGDLSALKQKLLGRTLDLLPGRRRWRGAVLAGALAASFLLGALAMGLLNHLWASSDPPAQADQVPPPKELPAPRTPTRTVAKAPATALAKEWDAFDSKDRRAQRFARAGDQYLQEDQDLGSALRCYRQALAAASPTELAVQPEDNWLVMALKTARRKEIGDAMPRR